MEPGSPTLQVDSLPSEPCQRTPRNQTTVRALKECQKEQPWGNVIKKKKNRILSSSSMLLVSTLLNILQHQCIMLELQALAFLLAQMVKNLPAMQETQVWSLGWEDPLENEMPTQLQYSCLENPTDRGVWWATVHGVTKSQTRLYD